VSTPFRFDSAWSLAVPTEELWEVLGRTDEYGTWWSWLRDFEAPGLHEGATARFTIRSPLAYSLRCSIRVDEIRPRQSIITTVDGDLRGPARLEITPDGGGVTARLAWSVTLTNPHLAGLARVARPAMAWAHDQVVRRGFEQFLHRALAPPVPIDLTEPVQSRSNVPGRLDNT
jgi:hypothetical protein